MKHRSPQGQRQAEIIQLIGDAHRCYNQPGASADDKQAAHEEILALTVEKDGLDAQLHEYACINPKCGNVYTAASAHGFGYFASWTRCDAAGRPTRTDNFIPIFMPKIGFCPECAEAIERDIDGE